MSTLLERLNARYYRTTDPKERRAIVSDIDSLMADTKCIACGKELEPGAGCLNPECPEGEQNLIDDRGDEQYHWAADEAAADYYLGHDL